MSGRLVSGYVLALAFCLAAMLMCGVAWVGLEDGFGWRWALGGVVVSLLLRINFPVLLGLYLFAHNIWGWPIFESAAFALPGLLLLLPSIAIDVFGALVGTAVRR